MQIIIFGVYQSGASPVTRLINLMGAYVGPEDSLIRPQGDNPKGVWERTDVQALHQEFLGSIGIKWDQLASHNPQRVDPKAKERFEQQAQEVLHNLDNHRPWVLKDPRMCLAFPLWRPLLEVPVCVHIHRNPIDVAQSLRARCGVPIRFGIALWEQYNLAALASTQGLPRLLVSYRQLMEEPLEAVRALYAGLVKLGVQGLRCPSEQEVQAFIKPNLVRVRSKEGLEREFLNQAQLELWQAFEENRILEEKIVAEVSAGARETLAESQLVQEIKSTKRELEVKFATKEAELAHVQEQVREQEAAAVRSWQEEVERLQEDLQAKTTELQTWEAEIKELQQQVATSEWTLSEMTAGRKEESERLHGKLQEQAAALQAKETELEQLQQQLVESQSGLVQKDGQLAMLQTKTDEHARDIARLTGWIEELDRGILALLSSQRWKMGHTLGELRRKVLLRPPVPLVTDLFDDVLEKFRTWRKSVARGPMEPPP